MSVHVRKGNKSEIGGCNACNDDNYSVIHEITLSCISIRVCNKCKKELIDKLRWSK